MNGLLTNFRELHRMILNPIVAVTNPEQPMQGLTMHREED